MKVQFIGERTCTDEYDFVEPSMYSGDAAFLSNYFDHLLLLLGRIADSQYYLRRCGQLLPTE